MAIAIEMPEIQSSNLSFKICEFTEFPLFVALLVFPFELGCGQRDVKIAYDESKIESVISRKSTFDIMNSAQLNNCLNVLLGKLT